MIQRIVLVMGVSGSGKSTVGQALASSLGYQYLEGDAFHPSANIEKMKSGIPLNDSDREPWLESIRAELLRRIAIATSDLHHQGGIVFSCSALREQYRTVLLHDLPCEIATVFLDLPESELARRLTERTGHFFPTALLSSQLQTLEPPKGAIHITGIQPLDEIIGQITAALEARRVPSEAR